MDQLSLGRDLSICHSEYCRVDVTGKQANAIRQAIELLGPWIGLFAVDFSGLALRYRNELRDLTL